MRQATSTGRRVGIEHVAGDNIGVRGDAALGGSVPAMNSDDPDPVVHADDHEWVDVKALRVMLRRFPAGKLPIEPFS